MATATEAEPELKTYWCHECDMSVYLTPSPSPSPSPSPLLCPHCHTHFLELMDSPFTQNDVESSPLPSALFDVVFQDAFSLLSPKPSTKTRSIVVVPIIPVTPSLLSQLDPNGVVLCAVCKDQIFVDSEAKQLPCNHLYHSDCITPWLELRGSCPLCRFQLIEEDDEEEEEEEEEEGRDVSAIRRELMVRLSEMTEDDFYGLRTTLSHIVHRHALLDSNATSMVNRENENHGGVVSEAGESGGGC